MNAARISQGIFKLNERDVVEVGPEEIEAAQRAILGVKEKATDWKTDTVVTLTVTDQNANAANQNKQLFEEER